MQVFYIIVSILVFFSLPLDTELADREAQEKSFVPKKFVRELRKIKYINVTQNFKINFDPNCRSTAKLECSLSKNG